MPNTRSLRLVLLVFSLAVALPSAVAQIVIATVPAGTDPQAVAVNSVTNMTYVVNAFCTDTNGGCPSTGTVTAINGADNSTMTVTAGVFPYSIAVNPQTNKIYVANDCGNDLTCEIPPGTVTVIDGATNNTQTVNVGVHPRSVAVNPVTNQIYVVNRCGTDPTCGYPYSLGTVTVIDGATLSTTNITVGHYAYYVTVNPVTNQIYVVNFCGNDGACNSAGTVTVIDGASNQVVSTVTVDFFPTFAAVNSVTNQIYAVNSCGNDVYCFSVGTVTVIDGASNNVVATVTVQDAPFLAAVNSVTNQIYVSNGCGDDLCQSLVGTVTVIDGGSNQVVNTVTVGESPHFVAANSVTNEIYVVNTSCYDGTCQAGTVTVINGANNNNTVSVGVGDNPQAIAINETTDRIYVTNYADSTVSIIAGAVSGFYYLNVSTSGNGTVTSTDGFINCPGTCYYQYPVNTPVTLNATPAQGWTFSGWNGACSGTGSCVVTMTQNLSVGATFTQSSDYTLTVATNGSGTVTSTDGYINCPGTCSHSYLSNTQVTLNAAPASGWTFSGWSGACSGTGSCVVTMTQDLLVGATFTQLSLSYKVLHTFTGGQDGSYPSAGLTLNGAGNLYGTAFNGGGTVYQLKKKGGTFNLLHNFAGGDGNGPTARVVFGSNGTLYGTTHGGGLNYGTTFNLRPFPSVCKTALCPWMETVLYSFAGSPDGDGPGLGDLIFDQAGNIYGTTVNGGANDLGAVFEMSPSGSGWTESVLYSFSGSDGAHPENGVIFDNAGNLYGTTLDGGVGGYGTVFELTPSGSGWTEKVLYSFQNGSDGSHPVAGLIFDQSGNLYGATSNGGTGGGGAVFELTPSGNSWTYSLVYSFIGGANCGPEASLVMDGAGNLYGTTVCDGVNKAGSVFKLTPSGPPWIYTSQHEFTGGSDGGNPISNVVFDANGNLYGTASEGGSGCAPNGCGVVWEITP